MAYNVGHLVQIIDIEKELKRLWEENDHEKKVKACLFTLIVYVKDCIRGDYIREVTKSISKEYPCRLISIHERKEKCFTTEVSQHTNLEGGVLIASDQITITASPDYLERIPYIITPEIVPDLPVYVIWGAALTNNPLLAALEKFATKIIFDAESAPPLPLYSKTLYEKIGKVPYGLQDIHWALSAGWRECLYQAFNNEEGLRFLKQIKTVKITYNDIEAKSTPFHDTLAWYVQAFLAAQLDWKLTTCKQDAKKVSYTSPSGPVEMQLAPEKNKNFFSGAILSIEIVNQNGDIYSFIRHKDHDKVILHVTKKNVCEMPAVFPFPDYQRSFNFVRELFFFVESDHYAKTLKCLSEIKG